MADPEQTLRQYYGSNLTLKETSVVFWLNAFIPKYTTNWRLVKQGPYKGQTMMLGPLPWSHCFLTDNRDFSTDPTASVRLQSFLFIENLEQEYKWWQYHRADETIELNCRTGEPNCSKKAYTNFMMFKLNEVTSTGIEFSLQARAVNPCFEGAPDIHYYIDRLYIDTQTGLFECKGAFTSFPSFESYIQFGLSAPDIVFQSQHNKGDTPWTLFAGSNRTFNMSGISARKTHRVISPKSSVIMN